MQCAAVVQSVRIPACHAGGRGFESRPLRHIFRIGFSRFEIENQGFQSVFHEAGPRVGFNSVKQMKVCATSSGSSVG